jgi:hypothetical protein
VPANTPGQTALYTVQATIQFGANLFEIGKVTFTSYAPDVASLNVNNPQGQPQFWTDPNLMYMYLSQQASATVSPSNTGITIQANTTANANFGGTFMVMQLIDSQRTATYAVWIQLV